jgi:hypothetical protein
MELAIGGGAAPTPTPAAAAELPSCCISPAGCTIDAAEEEAAEEEEDDDDDDEPLLPLEAMEAVDDVRFLLLPLIAGGGGKAGGGTGQGKRFVRPRLLASIGILY